MADTAIVCPKCGTKILLNEALTAEIRNELRAEFETNSKEQEQEFEEALLAKDQEFEATLKAKQAEIQEAANKRAGEAAETDLKDLRTQLEEKTATIKKTQDAELELRKRERKLTEQAEKAELEMARRLAEERGKLKTEVESTLREEHDLTIKEKDTQLERVRKQLEEATRRAEGKSQELQGEVLELELEELLRTTFPTDEIEAVKKGVRGADVIQRVRTQAGHDAGTILWETKRTKAWSGGWTKKLKEDQRREKADLAIIVSKVLPDSIADFGFLDGVWVTAFKFVSGLAVLFRNEIIGISQARTSLVDKSDKMEFLYSYLSGTEFKQRIEVIVESYTSLKDDLAREKRAMESTWAKRETQLERAIMGAAGLYGDLHGIIGASLPTVETLQLSPGDDTVEE